MGETEPKKRKPRKDKGKKRGKRMAKPRFQTGSIDFRTIGTQQTNATLLAGLLSSSRAMIPYQPQPTEDKEKNKNKMMEDIQKMISTELVKYAPRDLPNQPPTSQESFVPPPAQEPYTQQAQEEVSDYEKERIEQVTHIQSEKVRKAREELEQVQGQIIQKQSQLEQIQNEFKQTKEELTASSKKIEEQDQAMDLKRKSFLVEQVFGTNLDGGFARIKSDITGLVYSGAEITKEREDIRKQLIEENPGLKEEKNKKLLYDYANDIYRKQLLERAGLNPAFVDHKEVKAGERGRARLEYFYNPQKADLQRAQEERPQIAEEIEEGLSED